MIAALKEQREAGPMNVCLISDKKNSESKEKLF